MPSTIILASIMAGAVVSLLYAIRAEDRVSEIISKTSASAAFLILGLVRWTPGNPTDTWLIAALALCAVGDLCLLSDRYFDEGLIAFLLGHVMYVAAFGATLPLRQWPPLPLVLVAAAGVVAATWLWPHLGRRRTPVLAYIIVISVMVSGGISTAFRDTLPWTAAVGAVFFYLSDLAVARHRFVRPSFINRAFGLPAYYLGQLLLALTIGAS